MKEKIVILQQNSIKYPTNDDIFLPNKKYNEFNIAHERFSEKNKVFEMIRNSFYYLGLDIDNFGKKSWNPLGDNLIKPGDTVLIKPNLVMDYNMGGHGEDCLYTNPSIVSAVINYVWIALKKNGKIVVADAPMQFCNFDNLIKKSNYKKMIDYYKKCGVNIELKDLRGLVSINDNEMKQTIVKSEGIVVDLKNKSEFSNLNNEVIDKIRITNYNPDELLKHHNEHKNEYLISKIALEADVIINIPKPKSHRKAGVTIGLKNFVGVNVRKEYLPHHRFGEKKVGGDEYEKKSFLLTVYSKLLDYGNKKRFSQNNNYYKQVIAKIMLKISSLFSKIDKKFVSKQEYREGNWYGNDTIWRTIVDINKIIEYADKSGNMKKNPQRRVFNIADMIFVGEKEGPLEPTPKHCGIIAIGRNTVCFDEVLATIMGFDIDRINLYKNIRKVSDYKLVDSDKYGVIISNKKKWNNHTTKSIGRKNTLKIEPSSGWKGNVELK